MAQYSLKEADREFEKFNFSIAAKRYEKAYVSKPSTPAVEGMAKSYLQMRNFQLAESWYSKLVAMKDAPADSYISYAEVLKNNGKYAEARKQYQYLRDNHFPGVDVADMNRMIRSCDSAVFWMNNPSDIQVRNLSAINSEYADWGGVSFSGGLLFLSDRLERGFDNKKYGWTGNGYTRLYFADAGNAIKPLDTDNINGAFHTGLVALNADASEMVLSKTDNSVLREYKFGDRQINTVGFSLYDSRFVNGKWSRITPLSFGAATKGYSVGDPFLTSDGKFLYFSSDMPGGYGGTDIYQVERLSDGSWSTPRNLGPKINTKGQERCPAFDEKGNFYFASDNLIGMGGLDIYVVPGGNFWKDAPVNMGYPVNSPEDDFAFRFKDATTGFLSSNRQGGKGNDDVYSFQMNASAMTPSFIKLNGKVVNKTTLAPIANAVVTITDSSRNERRQISTDNDGLFSFRLDTISTYRVKAEKTGYLRDYGTSVDISTLESRDSVFVLVKLDSILLNQPQRLFGQIENIYFDYDKWDLKPEMKLEVDKLVNILREEPTLKVEISAYTDSRGKASYNMKLSQKRAQSVVNYLIEKGITEDRLEAKGYGETNLVNGCKDGVPCTEVEHLRNRRVEFTLFKR
ncbi:OmpA family protein [Chitinophaga sp.]|uniref:OmpA family protein n=1 Tax=Chitinophaga sp. TaxID=1869181 RepID=UPI0031D89BD9